MVRDDAARLAAQVAQSAKYRYVDPGLIASLGEAELAKGRSLKAAVKATKNKLHQAAGAYLPDRPDYAAWLRELEAARIPQARRAAAREIMARHASTRERLPMLDDFYATVLGDLPPVRHLMDLACGLNPLAQEWMPLAPDACYTACDIYRDGTDFLNRWFALTGRCGHAAPWNLLAGAPSVPALWAAADAPAPTTPAPTTPLDVVLLLKTIPCLEQLDRRIGPRLLASLDAPVLIISYPVQSLGGRAKGMAAHYSEHFAALTDGLAGRVTRFDFDTELVFRIERATQVEQHRLSNTD